MPPLVSILIPAYNAQAWIAETIQSALDQAWPNKEIIVVDDGSTDHTLQIAKTFESKFVKVIHQTNAGGPAARNKALASAQGDYIQWLDHDDLLAPNKLSAQLKDSEVSADARILLSAPFGKFFYRPEKAKFYPTALWQDLSPRDYFFHKFSGSLFFQSSSWLVSRKLTELAGPWWEMKSPDDDGEYFCRVVAASERIHFVAGAKCYWRIGNARSFSEARSDEALEAIFNSTCRCISHFRKIDDGEQAKSACLAFLRDRLIYFYPEKQELVNRMRNLANELGGTLDQPPLNWKYRLIKELFGWPAAKNSFAHIRRSKYFVQRSWDKLSYDLHRRPQSSGPIVN